MRKTKIIGTLGPKTRDINHIEEMLEAGIDGIRINFSHDNHEIHGETVKRVKKVREALNKPIPLILDTKGPEIRTGVMKDDKDYPLAIGDTITLTTEEIEGDSKRVSVTYKNLPFDLKRGSRILIDDGLIELKVKNLTPTEVECTVENGGMLGSRKGINIPDVFVNLPALTEKDIEDIQFGAKVGFDYIAASFIRCANDVITIRNILEENGGADIQIIAKIENRDGVNNIDEILEVSDAIMVARGDLGVEIPAEEVPIVQKMLIKKANAQGKPVITATQMLDSMIRNPRPTRAEASDVANAIFDGTSVIMLSGETAKGDYPLEAVRMMDRIARAAELEQRQRGQVQMPEPYGMSMTNAVSHATCNTAKELGAACILTITKSGHTARSVSKFKPSCPIIACTTNPRVWRQLNLVWGCTPLLGSYDEKDSTDEVFSKTVEHIEAMRYVKKGDIIVLSAGIPVGVAGTTNIMKVQYVGNVLAKGKGYGKQVVTGKASVVKVLDEARKNFKKGDILVANKTDNSYLPYMKKASAIVVQDGSLEESNHAVIVGKTLDIPVIIGAANCVEVVRNSTIVTVDSTKGYVYNGAL
ncbi:pyruvate kinase [Sporanaerobium hydrogeniformans]|uniref:Pyruvate kinase n=1 Tax=Sporanaerobium hydrogeniformans TaxID=3072179 RepID=A0AC61DEA4_9FIRM|nr:pyruvate kinase [Sporanaerobium hydrogeniformans]PHV71614.1 pyruvate kinase [Sporanaerobium hydrogeniformans]